MQCTGCSELAVASEDGRLCSALGGEAQDLIRKPSMVYEVLLGIPECYDAIPLAALGRVLRCTAAREVATCCCY